MGRSVTGDGDEYDTADEAAAEAAADEAWADWDDARADRPGESGPGPGGGGGGGDDTGSPGGGGGGPGGGGGGGGLPTAMQVRADVEWSGENRGTRTVTLDGLDLAEFQRATERARAATAKASSARPAASYRATGWTAQLRQLEATKHGRDALARAGFDASARTRRRWRAGTGGASKARREQIADAYQDARMWRVREANQQASEARKDLTTTLTETFRDRYSTTIRLHDIQYMELRRR